MAERLTRARRVEMANVAEREVMRYADDHALWHKHVHNVELDPIQVLKCEEMDRHQYTIDFSSRRTGKTAVKELHQLKHNASHTDQELGIVAPREAQSLVNLGYHLEAIRRSPILSAWIRVKGARPQFSDTYYQFENRSIARAYGIMAQVDGGDMTAASLEEVDDMPRDRLYSRFLLMMGSTRRLGASKESKNDPQIRITGVYKGADTLTDLIDSGQYRVIGAFHGERAREEIRRMIELGELDANAVDLQGYSYPVPIANGVVAAEMGLLNKEFLAKMRAELSPDEYARQILCVNTASRNLIWEKWLRWAIQLGVKAGLMPAPPAPGETYRKRGLLSFGYDASGHGEDPAASRHAFVVTEDLGGWVCFIWAKTWPPGTDEGTVKNDIKTFWRYYRPDYAIGDAYAVGMLTQLCDELYAEGLTPIDRRTIGDGESTASTWADWPFSPLRFEGMAKHSMASSVQALFYNRRAVLPYLDGMEDPEVADQQWLQRQIINIRAEATSKTYASYKMVKKIIGDDLFDAAMAAVWALVTRGAAAAPTVILTTQKTREQLLEAPA
jgi:hypothetical protein